MVNRSGLIVFLLATVSVAWPAFAGVRPSNEPRAERAEIKVENPADRFRGFGASELVEQPPEGSDPFSVDRFTPAVDRIDPEIAAAAAGAGTAADKTASRSLSTVGSSESDEVQTPSESREAPDAAAVRALDTLFDSRASTPSSPEYDVVIIGAGPAGMVAALELDRQSRDARLPAPRILLLEKRTPDARRPNFVGLHKKTLDMLARHGIDWVAQGLTRIMGVKVYADEWAERPNKYLGFDFSELYGFRFRPRRIRPRKAVTRVSDLTSSAQTITGFMPIFAVERALRSAVHERPNITVQYGERLDLRSTLTQGPDKSWRLSAIRDDGSQTEYRTRFLVGADGAHSVFRSMLKVDWNVTRAYARLKTRLMIGLFDRPGFGWFTLYRRVAIFGGKETTAAVVNIPPQARFKDDASKERWWRRKIAGEIPLETPLLLGPVIVDIQMMRATQCVVGGTAFLIGDAIRTGHPATGNFLQGAIRDAARLAAAYVRLAAAETPRECERIVRWFETSTLRATEALQRFASERFRR